jgi:hypothetical protein
VAEWRLVAQDEASASDGLSLHVLLLVRCICCTALAATITVLCCLLPGTTVTLAAREAENAKAAHKIISKAARTPGFDASSFAVVPTVLEYDARRGYVVFKELGYGINSERFSWHHAAQVTVTVGGCTASVRRRILLFESLRVHVYCS